MKADKDTRFFIDLDLESWKILGWDHDDRFELIVEKPIAPFHHRVFISKGQYQKLEQHHQAIHGHAGHPSSDDE